MDAANLRTLRSSKLGSERDERGSRWDYGVRHRDDGGSGCRGGRASFLRLGSLDGPKLREVLHIPGGEALRQAGLGKELIAKVDHSLPYKLDGLRRIAERRSEANRTRVEAFNKLKHGLLAFPTRETDSKIVVQLIKGRGYKQGEIHLNTLTLEVSAANIHNMAGSALAVQPPVTGRKAHLEPAMGIEPTALCLGRTTVGESRDRHDSGTRHQTASS